MDDLGYPYFRKPPYVNWLLFYFFLGVATGQDGRFSRGSELVDTTTGSKSKNYCSGTVIWPGNPRNMFIDLQWFTASLFADVLEIDWHAFASECPVFSLSALCSLHWLLYWSLAGRKLVILDPTWLSYFLGVNISRPGSNCSDLSCCFSFHGGRCEKRTEKGWLGQYVLVDLGRLVCHVCWPINSDFSMRN